ncbi:MAG: winged helix DNA-binding domain-containing protein [Nocardioides sp.]|nr:winged helix DNA-binding domain-containing protein [Nocardioides sp.]
MGDVVEVRTTWAQALAWRLERQLLSPIGSVSAGSPSVRAAPRRTRATLPPLRCAGRQWELKSWVEFYRLSPVDWPDFRAAVREALTGGPLTVTELGQALAVHRAYRHLQPVFDEGAGTLIKPLTWQGDVSLGRARDGKLTLLRLDDNPRWGGIPDLDEAGPRAVAAYFASYGPAPLDNLHHWLGDGLSAGRTRIKSWLAALGDRLVLVDIDGTEAYVLCEDVDQLLAAEASDAVRLLPGHDQWVMGPGTKDVHVTPPALRELMTRKANPVVLGGVVCGTWTRKGDDLTVTWRDGRPRPDSAVRLGAERLGEFLERDLGLTLSS